MKKFVTLVSVAILAMSLAACRGPSFLEQQKDPVIMFSF